MSDAIVIDRLTKHYGRRRVVDLVNLRIPTGCVYGFLGRNGAGKSTLIKMLLGMVQPDAGHATLLGEDIGQLRPELAPNCVFGGGASAISVDDGG